MVSARIVIIGAGSAGISVAARLAKLLENPDITIVDPAKLHYYQPLFTLVGGGVVSKSRTARQMKDLIPKGVKWLTDRAIQIVPEQNEVQTAQGTSLNYDYLVVCPGIQLDWQKITGLYGHLGKHDICSNYSVDHLDATWEAIRGFRGGTAIFTFPATPVKCAGAPQKIMYLAEHYWRKKGLRDQTKIIFASAAAGIFAVKKYAETLTGIVQKRGIETRFRTNLAKIEAQNKTATFVNLDTNASEDLKYDMIHVTPPMSSPDFIKQSSLANKDGWVDVDKHTLQHTRFKNVFALGDASSLPTSKTGAAIRKQAPVLTKNLMSAIFGSELEESYDGYTSCPLVTGYGRLVLAEFDYDLKPQETFPFDQSKERLSMYLLKKYALPQMYWHGMLKGKL